ncbi:hypothetical protein ASPSYDRAFT_56900 [Aspergillus sydowii CBS 593.65]|uniref:Ubiquitin-like domain-containing protein n=1 Tax=Aspergillus sydowii CBS 593.65 TaxID=1036612 RepID=A0A1L9TIP8_9EURO|nr:uncharacterized protein ASPSYDRAFT_56900 [Aspergillus sydowii CBS 593.65]OJJ59289.1 hypothetical protein ASPSYDRAFT_56900 [Aspergillus sydowii CBS 593.65]
MPSYFNKPSWASRGDENGDSEFYRRAGQTYEDIVATKRNARERRESSPRSNTHKRRRLASSPNDGDIVRPNCEHATAEGNALLRNSSPPQNDSQHNTRSVKTAAHKPLVSNDSTITDTKGSISPRPQNSPETNLPDLRAELTSTRSDITDDGNLDTHPKNCLVDTAVPTDTDTSCDARSTAYDNTVVQIFITSKIPKTKSLIIHRKMSQSLKGVRLAWCAHQNLPRELHSTVFLAWKGRRLFDVTTCRSLNIGVHNAFTKELPPFENCFSDVDDCRIHMEAVTEQTFAGRSRPSPIIARFDTTPSAPTEPRGTDKYIQSEIILKCPEFDEFKTRISLATHVSQVVEAFREARSIPTELTIYLTFDGDRLDPQCCLADYDIADGDLLDVLVKKEM